MTLFLRFSVACALFDRRPRPRHARLDVAMPAIARLCRLAAIGPFLLRKMFAGAFQHRPANGRRRIDGGLGLFPPPRGKGSKRARGTNKSPADKIGWPPRGRAGCVCLAALALVAP